MAARARRRRASHRPPTAQCAAARRARTDLDLGRSRRGHRRRSRPARRCLASTRLRRKARMLCASGGRARCSSRPRLSPSWTAGATAGARPASTTAWAAVEVSGADAAQALMQATSADLASGSPSAAVLVFGLRGLLARTPSGFRVHVESPWLETLLAWLDGV